MEIPEANGTQIPLALARKGDEVWTSPEVAGRLLEDELHPRRHFVEIAQHEVTPLDHLARAEPAGDTSRKA